MISCLPVGYGWQGAGWAFRFSKPNNENHDKMKLMKAEQQRIACAEVEGWRLETTIHSGGIGPSTIWRSPEGKLKGDIPNYKSDLNAVRRARKHFTPAQNHTFTLKLYEVMDRDTAIPSCSISECIDDPVEIASILLTASAAQELEAILRTLNLWTE